MNDMGNHDCRKHQIGQAIDRGVIARILRMVLVNASHLSDEPNKEALKQLKWVHVLTANVKGNIRGVYHGVSEKHLGRYLAEFSYRFNRRAWDPQLFNRTVTACLTTSTVTFAELKA